MCSYTKKYKLKYWELLLHMNIGHSHTHTGYRETARRSKRSNKLNQNHAETEHLLMQKLTVGWENIRQTNDRHTSIRGGGIHVGLNTRNE